MSISISSIVTQWSLPYCSSTDVRAPLTSPRASLLQIHRSSVRDSSPSRCLVGSSGTLRRKASSSSRAETTSPLALTVSQPASSHQALRSPAKMTGQPRFSSRSRRKASSRRRCGRQYPVATIRSSPPSIRRCRPSHSPSVPLTASYSRPSTSTGLSRRTRMAIPRPP